MPLVEAWAWFVVASSRANNESSSSSLRASSLFLQPYVFVAREGCWFWSGGPQCPLKGEAFKDGGDGSSNCFQAETSCPWLAGDGAGCFRFSFFYAAGRRRGWCVLDIVNSCVHRRGKVNGFFSARGQTTEEGRSSSLLGMWQVHSLIWIASPRTQRDLDVCRMQFCRRHLRYIQWRSSVVGAQAPTLLAPWRCEGGEGGKEGKEEEGRERGGWRRKKRLSPPSLSILAPPLGTSVLGDRQSTCRAWWRIWHRVARGGVLPPWELGIYPWKSCRSTYTR